MKLSNIKRNLSLVLLFLVSIPGYAQFLRTSYFMEGSHYRQQLNPALTPDRGYINIPAIGSLNASVNSSSLSFQDVMDIIENSEDGNYFMSNDFINRLDATNNLNVNLNTDIISAGWYKGKNFWSINIGVRNDIGASIPKSMFQFMRNMDGLNIDDWSRLAHINEQVGAQSLEINSYIETGVGYARDINDRLTVGGKVKVLLGVGNLKMNINNISVSSNLSGYENIDFNNPTYEQLQNLRGEANINVDATLESSSKLLELTQENDYIDDIDFGSFGFAGYGAGVDLGVSYKLLNNLTLSASFLDLGFIKWSESHTSIATAKANHNYNLRDESDRYEFVDMVSSGEVLNYDLLQMEVNESAKESRSTGLTSSVVVGAEYALLNNWLVVGALYTARFTNPKTLNELTFSANVRPSNAFNCAISYSVIQSAGKSFGVAAKLGPLFIGTDYMFLGKNNTKNLNAYIGLSIPLGKKKSNEI